MQNQELIDQLEKCKLDRDVDGLNLYANQLIEIGQNESDSLSKAIGLYYLSLSKFNSRNYNEALVLSKEGLTLCDKYKNTKYYILLCNLVGVSYGTQIDYANSLSYFLKSYYASIEYANSQDSYLSLCNIGTTFFNLGFLDKAIEYYLMYIEERKLSIDNLERVDGILIINLYGAYVKQRNEEKIHEIEKWINVYCQQYVNEIINEDYQMYQVLLAYEKKDLQTLEGLLDKVIQSFHKSSDVLHTFKNLIDVLKVCIEMKNQEYCDKLITILKEIQNKYPEIKNEIKLNDLLIQKHIVFQETDELNTELMKFYENKKQEEMINEADIKKNMLMNIELEKVLHEQAAILKKNEELLKHNELDEFTMVYNKTSFQKYVNQSLSVIKKDCYQVLILLDIDEFKMINDSYGHSVGDKVLTSVANVLKESIRKNEYIGRIGGDEFCIFMKDVYTQEYLEEKLNKIIDHLHNIKVDKLNEDIKASFGVCMVNIPTAYQQVFEIADKAMYQAKKQGRNQFCIEYISE